MYAAAGTELESFLKEIVLKVEPSKTQSSWNHSVRRVLLVVPPKKFCQKEIWYLRQRQENYSLYYLQKFCGAFLTCSQSTAGLVEEERAAVS